MGHRNYFVDGGDRKCNRYGNKVGDRNGDWDGRGRGFDFDFRVDVDLSVSIDSGSGKWVWPDFEILFTGTRSRGVGSNCFHVIGRRGGDEV